MEPETTSDLKESTLIGAVLFMVVVAATMLYNAKDYSDNQFRCQTLKDRGENPSVCKEYLK